MNRQILFENRRAIGDAIVLSAAIRDFKFSYPDIDICVSTEYPELWINNPHIKNLTAPVERVGLFVNSYVRASQNRSIKIHYIQVFHKVIKDLIGLKVDCLIPKPDLHLSNDEIENRILNYPYWVIVAGTKRHATTKQWHFNRYQQVVNILSKEDNLKFVQVGTTKDNVSSVKHIHPKLSGVVDLVDKTNLRQLMSLIYNSSGVICPITSSMHIAAAFDKPCVVLAGGREEYTWSAYSKDNDAFNISQKNNIIVSHRYLNTIGKLQCCRNSGCWKSHVEAEGTYPFTPSLKTLCPLPIKSEPMTVPKCLDLISVTDVVEAVRSYY